MGPANASIKRFGDGIATVILIQPIRPLENIEAIEAIEAIKPIWFESVYIMICWICC